ncbi:MAG: dihydrofolate reductase [Eubacterium sp.]|jgi:dihydrofolate reductase|nr:dihydrofolate reductase [Eubacterium sp.]
MIAIAAVDENWGIGRGNKLLARLPEDMRRFSALTAGGTVIMGRRTFESIPNAPLPNRETLLLTGSPENYPGIKCFLSIESLLDNIKSIDNKIYVCGGETVYRQLLPYCSQALITKVYHKFEADSFFPDLSAMPEWKIESQSDDIITNLYRIRFLDFKNSQKV